MKVLHFITSIPFLQSQRWLGCKFQCNRMFVRWSLCWSLCDVAYGPPNGDPNEIENYFKNIISKWEITNKELFLVGEFNINVLDFNERKMVQNFVDLMFQHGLIPTINKPTRVTRNTATAIDHIITNSVKTAVFKKDIIITDISDHFLIFFMLNVLLMVPSPGKNLYTNKITPVIQ